MNFTYLSPVRLTGCILALTLGSSLQAKDIHQPGEPQSESRARVEIVRHSVRQDTPIRESAFVYDLARDNFDLTSYLERQAPHLLTHEEAISHWSGFASIHPRIALALMETRTQVVSNPTNATLEEPFGALSNESGFSNQLGDVLTRLSQRFYNIKGARRTTGPSALLQGHDLEESPASLVLASAVAEGNRSIRAEDPLAAFEAGYAQLFPEAVSTLRESESVDRSMEAPSLDREAEKSPQWGAAYNNFIPPDTMMQMPWHQGYWWIPNGAHAHSGSGYPLSSIDVSYSWPSWGGPTYSVAAAHGGYVRVFSRCQVRVTHPNGWATNYYHLEGIQVSNGQWVNRNTKLANYASDRWNALCQGGSSTGPHLHFSLLYNGQYRSLQDVNLGPYKIDVGRWSYDANCYNYWLYNEYQNRRTCAWNSIYNYGAKQ